MTDDQISRQAAIDVLNKMKIYRPLDSDRYVISDCLNKIVNLPSAQQWIPCSERLPIIVNNIGARVLITTSWGLVKEAHYCVDHWEIDDISYKLTSAVAWMPLPEPYKGEGHAKVN